MKQKSDNRKGGKGQALVERNLAIVVLRELMPERFTFSMLGSIFDIDKKTVDQIHKRDAEKYRQELTKAIENKK